MEVLVAVNPDRLARHLDPGRDPESSSSSLATLAAALERLRENGKVPKYKRIRVARTRRVDSVAWVKRWVSVGASASAATSSVSCGAAGTPLRAVIRYVVTNQEATTRERETI